MFLFRECEVVDIQGARKDEEKRFRFFFHSVPNLVCISASLPTGARACRAGWNYSRRRKFTVASPSTSALMQRNTLHRNTVSPPERYLHRVFLPHRNPLLYLSSPRADPAGRVNKPRTPRTGPTVDIFFAVLFSRGGKPRNSGVIPHEFGRCHGSCASSASFGSGR